jgi:dethiobiotin synthetase
LKTRGIKMAGIVFNGKPNSETETYILNHTQLPCILRINEEHTITPETIRNYSKMVNLV